MNTVQNGKGDRPRNNWGPEWSENYDAINWHRSDPKPKAATSTEVTEGTAKKPLRNPRKATNP